MSRESQDVRAWRNHTILAMPPAQSNDLLSMGIDRIFQYDGQEQVAMSVENLVPGSWFGHTAAGALTSRSSAVLVASA